MYRCPYTIVMRLEAHLHAIFLAKDTSFGLVLADGLVVTLLWHLKHRNSSGTYVLGL